METKKCDRKVDHATHIVAEQPSLRMQKQDIMNIKCSDGHGSGLMLGGQFQFFTMGGVKIMVEWWRE